jgi:hypothetical protein
MERMSTLIDIGDDRLPTPIAVCINDIAGITLGE